MIPQTIHKAYRGRRPEKEGVAVEMIGKRQAGQGQGEQSSRSLNLSSDQLKSEDIVEDVDNFQFQCLQFLQAPYQVRVHRTAWSFHAGLVIIPVLCGSFGLGWRSRGDEGQRDTNEPVLLGLGFPFEPQTLPHST